MGRAARSRRSAALARNPVFYAGLLIVGMLVAMSVAPGLFTDRNPSFCDLAYSRQGPGGGAPLGYNLQGCDLYARMVYGARASVAVGLLATAGVVAVGGVIGMLAGYFGGWVDAVLSRLTDVFFGIPLLLGALVVLVALPSDATTPAWQTTGKVVLVLSALGWTTVARIMRSTVMQVKLEGYVESARAVGSGHRRILARHVVPNVVSPILAWAVIAVGTFIAAEATLSFIGIGLRPPVISWGVEISEAQAYVRQSPHMVLVPSAFLAVTVLAFVMLGEAVRSALDPRPRS